MAAAVEWLADFSVFWGTRFDRLDGILLNMKQDNEKETVNE